MADTKPAAMTQNERIGVGVVGLLIVIGSLLPWATIAAISIAGTRGDGVFTLV